VGSLFSRPKKPSLPPVPIMPAIPPPPPTPVPSPEVEDEAAKKARRRSGFAKTILTGDLEPVQTGKKKLLGG